MSQEVTTTTTKINIVEALRELAKNESIKNEVLQVPEGCEKYGFVEGYHNLSQALQFIADMME